MTLSEEKVMDIIKGSNISLLSVAYSTRSVETVSIQRLPVFLSAAEHLNFTRAAEEQCISQTAVSQQVKLLEQELGYALFVRGKRGVSLTPAGEVFYRQCRQLMIRYNGAAAQGKKVALGNATDLRIGYAGAYELWTIVSQIRKYHRQHPEAEIEFQLGSNQSLLGALAEGQLDMAVLSGFGVELGKELDSRVTLSDPCMVMISASPPLAAKKEIHPRELRGKQGRFRQNLLGKRVDYSGRSVIVVGPELKMYQCGLPKEMALELFKPFVIKRLVELGLAHNIKSAKRLIERGRTEVWDVLEEVIVQHPVLLNRAPTLHRLGIQAFEPVLVEGRAIKLHPLVCTAFNADFDGDQMPVHVPLSSEAQAEARFLMLASNNILKPADGRPVVVPTQDMIIGVYYLTIEEPALARPESIYSNIDEAVMAYQTGNLPLHAKTNIRISSVVNGKEYTKVLKTTVGRAIFNQAVPQDLGFVDRSVPGNEVELEIDKLVGKSELGQIISRCFARHGAARTAEVLDRIKRLGFDYATKGAITVGVKDAVVPAEKKALIKEAEDKVALINRKYRRGLTTDDERYRNVIAVWKETTENVLNALMTSFDDLNPINMMIKSGARGNKDQIRQLAGMRGLMADPAGRTIEIPIKANFREGLTVLDFFISSHGTRKGLADTALRTADSGYLTRRLVDVCQDVIIREDDCQETHPSLSTPKGVWVEDIVYEKAVIEPLKSRIKGRVSVDELKHPETGEVLVRANELITEEIADAIVAAGYKRVQIRSVFTCRSDNGVCAKCYGADMSTNKLVSQGEAVGIIAAQSIGEPGTQLTMRTFHTGGVAGSDITQGLPRVEEIFEARKPKTLAILSDIAGTVKVTTKGKGQYQITVTAEDGDARTYNSGFNVIPCVADGDVVAEGDELTPGSLNPHDLLRIKGVTQLQNYLLREVQTVYKRQSVEIGDKHIELIVRQMLRKVRIEDSGDTELLPGEMVDIYKVEAINAKVAAEGGAPATSRRILLGITKASLATESFLSAASFQETTRVLTEAAIKGKTDTLSGLKENVMIGKLIPAGTGARRYKNVVLEVEQPPVEAEEPQEAPAEIIL